MEKACSIHIFSFLLLIYSNAENNTLISQTPSMQFRVWADELVFFIQYLIWRDNYVTLVTLDNPENRNPRH